MADPVKDLEVESENEFFDACDDLANEKDKKECLNEKTYLENYDSDDEEDDESDMPDFESRPEVKKLKSKLNKLHLSDETDFKTNDSDKSDDDNEKEEHSQPKEKFIPLHERLNNEMKQNKSESDDEDHVKNSGDIHKLDPFYINEDLIKQEEEQLDETQKQDRLNESHEYKKTGNELFKEDKYEEALEMYTKALRTCPFSFSKERSIFYSNRSVCFLKMKDLDKCIKECSQSINLDPTFVKPLLRRAECHETNDKLDEAVEDYKKLIDLEPRVMSHKQKCYQLEEKIKERNEKLKEEMMGKLKELGNMVLKP